MKTDRVLTMSECLANWYIGAIGVKRPADDARHIPITAEDDLNGKKAHGCRCDRWGHPCPDCVQDCLEKRQLCAPADELVL